MEIKCIGIALHRCINIPAVETKLKRVMIAWNLVQSWRAPFLVDLAKLTQNTWLYTLIYVFCCWHLLWAGLIPSFGNLKVYYYGLIILHIQWITNCLILEEVAQLIADPSPDNPTTIQSSLFIQDRNLCLHLNTKFVWSGQATVTVEPMIRCHKDMGRRGGVSEIMKNVFLELPLALPGTANDRRNSQPAKKKNYTLYWWIFLARMLVYAYIYM